MPEEPVLEANIVTVLSDNPRSGRPALFDAVCRSFIIGIACNNPGDYGFVRSHWSLPVLQKVIINKRIVTAISAHNFLHAPPLPLPRSEQTRCPLSPEAN